MQRSTALVFAAIGIGACTAPGRQASDPLVVKPATWTRGEVGRRNPTGPHAVLLEHVFCHPEPTPLLNTVLWVWSMPRDPLGRGPGFHRELLEWYVQGARSRPSAEVRIPITRSEGAGAEVLTLEVDFDARSPHDGSLHRARGRYWSISLRDRVVLIQAQQPVVPDPQCGPELDRMIHEVLLGME